MSIGERIKQQRIKIGMSQEDVAKAIDTTKQAIYKYENGIVTNIPMDKVEKLAQVFFVSPAYLMGWDEKEKGKSVRSTSRANLSLIGANVRPVSRKRLPMLGNVACGEPTFADEQHDTFVDAVSDVGADFCLTAKGDSMINARIFDGDILFVKQQESVDDGEIAVVLIEDETTVKRVYYDKENNVITLMPENPTHKPMRFEGAKLEQIRILGKVVAGQYVIK